MKNQDKPYQKVFLIILLVINAGLSFYCMGSTLGLLLPTLVEEMGLTTLQISSLTGAIPLGALFFSFVSGPILDNLKTKVVMVVTVIALGIGIFARSFCGDFGMLYALFVINGAIHALILPAGNKISTYWFGKDKIFFLSCALVAAQGLFGVLGYRTFLPLCALLGGWRNLYRACGVIFLVSAIVWVILIPDKTAKESKLNQDLGIDVEHHTFAMGIKEIFGSRHVWMILLATFFYFGTVNLWMSLAPSALMNAYDMQKAEAAAMCSWISMGSIFGYIFSPIISNKLGYRKPCLAFGMVGSVILEALALRMPVSPTFTIVLIFCAGFLHGWGCAGPQAFLLEAKEVGGVNAGLAVSFFYVFAKLSAVVYPYVYALFMSKDMAMTAALGAATMGGAIGAIFIFMARETGPKAKEKNEVQASE